MTLALVLAAAASLVQLVRVTVRRRPRGHGRDLTLGELAADQLTTDVLPVREPATAPLTAASSAGRLATAPIALVHIAAPATAAIPAVVAAVDGSVVRRLYPPPTGPLR